MTIEINLMPEELRVKRKKDFTFSPAIIIVIAFGIFFLTHIAFYSTLKFKTIDLAALQGKDSSMLNDKKNTKTISGEIKDLEKRIKAAEDLRINTGIDWAEMLSGLNEAVINDVWLAGFSPAFKKDEKQANDLESGAPAEIDISGFALGKSEAATVIVAKFIDSLKSKSAFAKYFDSIELSTLRSQIFENRETMAFVLVCKVKKNKNP